MQSEIRSAFQKLLQGESLDGISMEQAFGAVMDGRCSDIEIAAFLTGLAVKGETVDELAGAALAMRARAARLQTTREGLIDTCGTGGDQLHTFNISTATAFVLAGAGVPVAKHGNRSVSSSSGSADVLEALGVNIELTPDQAGACLDAVGLSFFYARTFHSAMKHVASVRQQLAFRTIFNLLGPLTNPAAAEFQLLGAARDTYAAKIAGAASKLNLKRACIVCGNNQIDEVSLWESTNVWEVRGSELTQWSCTAADFDLQECTIAEIKVNSSGESAKVVEGLLRGEKGAHRNMVLANAAMGLYCRGISDNLKEAASLAAKAIDDGRAWNKLEELRHWTNKH
ncbi:anthranilate phosphoribosyltransferase [Planctomicrobium sp. SH668]|uniref:anthranilate phosphoribosyltransferase n=1 Tax=Planctomicrobium sp. SH668 TaxID=3448126 RepID=UPI003F5C0088